MPLLPETFTTSSCSPKNCFHLWYASDGDKSFKVFDEDLNTLADVQGTGKQVICPGSKHECGSEYKIIKDVDFAFIPYSELEAILKSFDKSPKKVEIQQKTFVPKGVSNDLGSKILDSVQMSDILSGFGVDISKNPTNCPLHTSKRGKCLGWNDTTAHCFHCEKSWNKFSLIREVKNLTDKETFEWLAEKAGMVNELNNVREEYKKSKALSNRTSNVLTDRVAGCGEDFFYLDEEGHKRFDYKKFSDFISEKHIFKTTIDNETIFYYDDGFYKPEGEMVIKRETEKILKRVARNQLVAEVLGHIKRSTYIDRKEFNKDIDLVSLENGIFNLKTKEFTHHTPDFFLTYKLPIKYDKEATCPKIEGFLSQILYPDDVAFIQEWFGFSLCRDYFLKVMFIAFGDTDAGKTTLFNLFERFIGDDNISHQSLQDLSNDRFSPVKLYNKHLNIRDDLPDEEINNTGLIKQVTGESTISAQEKNQKSFDFRNFAKMMFACNRLPEVPKGDSAFWNRANGLITFPFKFVKEPDPNNGNEKKKRPKDEIEKEIQAENEISGLFNWALEGYYRVREKNGFTGTKSEEEAEKFWNLNSSPVASFCEERLYLNVDGTLDKKELYGKYVDFCKEKKLAALGYDTFCRRIISHYGSSLTETQLSGDKRIRVWKGIGLKVEKQCDKCNCKSWVVKDEIECRKCDDDGKLLLVSGYTPSRNTKNTLSKTLYRNLSNNNENVGGSSEEKDVLGVYNEAAAEMTKSENLENPEIFEFDQDQKIDESEDQPIKKEPDEE
jgi:putative DNA primase/helicase